MMVIRVLLIEGDQQWVMKTLEKSYIAPDSPKFFVNGARIVELARTDGNAWLPENLPAMTWPKDPVFGSSTVANLKVIPLDPEVGEA